MSQPTFAQQLACRERNALAAYLAGASVDSLARAHGMTTSDLRRLLERVRQKERMDMLRAAGITPIPGHTYYVPRNDAAGTGGFDVYVPLTPPDSGSAPAPAAASNGASRSDRQALPGHRNPGRCSYQDGYRHLPRMLRLIARLAQSVLRFACGTSVGTAVVGGTAQPTSGGSASEVRP